MKWRDPCKQGGIAEGAKIKKIIRCNFFAIKVAYMKNRLYLAPRIKIKFNKKKKDNHDGASDK
jgi:hypothetical protein